MVKPWMVPLEQLNWNYEEWLDHYQASPTRTYEGSVLEAADESCLLDTKDLARLLRKHGENTMEYIQVHADAVEEGLEVLPLNHAGQVLYWLGY
jgi:hypothetical protein